MRALVVSSPGVMAVETLPDPSPGPGDVVIDVAACGVCGTDLHVLDGAYPVTRFPIVPGHEFSGVVVARGRDVISVDVGAFVAVDPVVACGHCSRCREGWTNLCENWRGYGVALDGGFADFAVVRADRALPVSPAIPRDWAPLIEPLSCAIHALDRMGEVRVGESVLVIGSGPTGLMLTSLLGRSGGLVDTVERVPERRALATTFGARRTAADAEELEQPGGWDLVVEATGSTSGVETALRVVRRAGRVHIFGVAHPDALAHFSPYQFFDRELTMTGSQSLRLTFGRAAEVMATGFLDGGALITDTVPLEDVATAFDNVRHGRGLKTQVAPGRRMPLLQGGETT
jgi:2-desacetyl-2-hydroxyethyl bacteriochlorophyllide A dehydrogenase